MGPATVVTLNYVGNVGRHFANAVEANPGDPALCLSLTKVVSGPGTNGHVDPILKTNLYTLRTERTVEGTRPTLGLAFGSNPYLLTSATANYNSLQTSSSIRHRSGMCCLATPFSRSFDNSSALTDRTFPYNSKASYGLSKFDVTHNFVGSYNIRLPFDRYVEDRRWAKSVVGGWSISGITRFASGLPITLSETDDRSLVGFGGDVPNYTGGNINGDHNPRHGNKYFSTSAFTKETLGVFGNSTSAILPRPWHQ